MKRLFFLFGLASLCFLLGAAVMFFDLPPSAFLRRGFAGGMGWSEWRRAQKQTENDEPPLSVGRVDKPDKTCDGFTLLCHGEDNRAVLIDMRGQTVHQWHAPLRTVWPEHPLLGRGLDHKVYFTDGYLFPNGDLLAIVETDEPVDVRNALGGLGLVKLDKDSRVLWKYRGYCHHCVDVGEDGAIYTISNEMIDKMPRGLEYVPTPCVVDFIDILSPEGQRRRRIPILEAFRDSPYAALFCMLERSKMYGQASPPAPPGVVADMPFLDDKRRRDVLHTNTVRVLPRALAAKFPLFQPGQLLFSPRNLDAIAVLDPQSEKVVWAARGPWRAQHDPSFLDNGHLLIFDNMGSPMGSRVLEYHPGTQAFDWTYPDKIGTPFYSRIRGMCRRLANGNTLIVNSDGGEVFEATPGREVVWSCSCGVELKRAVRYSREQLPFLQEKRPRP